MYFYLFKDPARDPELAEFRIISGRQNLRSLLVFAICALAWALIYPVLSRFLPLHELRQYYREELPQLQHAFVVCSGVYVLTYLFLKRRDLLQSRLSRIVAWIYSLAIILFFLMLSMLGKEIQPLILMPFLVGCFIIALLMVFTFREILLLSLLLLLLCYSLLPQFQIKHRILLSGYIAGNFSLICLYMLSRMRFSAQYNHFRQIRTIERKNEEINRINMVQTDMLAIVAHDLRSPLNNIASIADLLSSGYADNSEKERKELYSMIGSSCRAADDFTRDMLDVVRNPDPAPLQTSLTSLNELIAETVDLCRTQIKPPKQITVLALSHVTANVHPQKIQRVLDNLLQNAIKFTPDDGSIRITLNANEDMVYIAVSDNGIGIPEELQPQIFERFTPAGRDGLRGEKSYGLGLSICQQTIVQHKGRISVESTGKTGEGTTFHIILPRSS